MGVTKFELDFMDALKSDVKILSHALSSNLAHKISDEMVQEYQYVIDRFYSEYDPEYYIRHSERSMKPGLNKTFKKYYKNPHNTFSEATDLFSFRIIPGVSITTDHILYCNGEKFDITSVEDVKGRGMYIEVLAKKVVATNG